jgi:hypothetical protein
MNSLYHHIIVEQRELYMQYKGHNKCTVHTQHSVTHRMDETCRTHIIRKTKLCCCHHPCHVASNIMPQLGLGGTLPISHLKMLLLSTMGTPGVGF